MANIIASIRLTNTIPPSNKEYRAQITDNGDDTFLVDGFNCSIGGNPVRRPQEGGKPLTLAQATVVYQKLVDSKTRDGYVPDGASSGSIATVIKERTATGLLPQLLNEINRDEALRLIDDPHYGLQIKEDGERGIIRSIGGVITAANKKGIETNIPEALRTTIASIPGNFEIDGEIVGNADGTTTYHVFDLLSVNESDQRSAAYEDRYKLLALLLGVGQPGIVRAPLYAFKHAKAQAFAQAEAHEREGVVFKRLTALHRAGRPSSGGDQLKFKFVAELSAIVAAINAKDSVALELIANGNGYDTSGSRVSVGNVRVNGANLAVGDIIEIKYLYMQRPGGALYQPRLKSGAFSPRRADVDTSECTTAQIKYKGLDAVSIGVSCRGGGPMRLCT